MSTTVVSAGKRKVKLAYQKLVQDSAHGREVDPDEVDKTLMLAGKSYDDLERNITALEECLAARDAFEAIGYGEKIEAHKAMLATARQMRADIEPQQAAIQARLKEIKELEERGRHQSALEAARDRGSRELLDKCRKLLGTTDLDTYPDA